MLPIAKGTKAVRWTQHGVTEAHQAHPLADRGSTPGAGLGVSLESKSMPERRMGIASWMARPYTIGCFVEKCP
jgi:hypothetical protein